MVNHKHTLFLCLTPLLVSGCGSSDNDPVDFNGEYSIEAPTSTLLDSNGGTCGDASGSMLITDNVIDGSVLSTNGFTLDIEGTISENGQVVGGFAQGSNTVADFTGSISGTTGSGEWEDNFDCVGTWTAEKI